MTWKRGFTGEIYRWLNKKSQNPMDVCGRLWMRRYWPTSFLGTTPMGIICILTKGNSWNGPAILPWEISFASFSSTISGNSLADFKFGDALKCLSPWTPIRKPLLKPPTNCLLLQNHNFAEVEPTFCGGREWQVVHSYSLFGWFELLFPLCVLARHLSTECSSPHCEHL